MSIRRINRVVFVLPILCALLFSINHSKAQVSLKPLDLARMPEGASNVRGTAQYLINRDGFARDGIQLGRSLFHQDFAKVKDSGCNGIPCSLRDSKATRAGPNSLFEASSCATCHSTPDGSAGFGPRDQNSFTNGNTIRTPDMFGAGLIQELAVEATKDLKRAEASHAPHVTANGVNYDQGLGIGNRGSVDRDLVVRPFGRKGVESHVRAFASRAAFKHLGIQTQDAFQCPDGDKDGDGRCDGPIEQGIDPDSDGVSDELTQGGLSLLEHYLINYPVPGRGPITSEVRRGEQIFSSIGCAVCHRPEMRVRKDPRIEHISVFWNPETRRYEAERRLQFHLVDDGYLDPDRRRPVQLVVANRQPFTVALYADLKRHDMGPAMSDGYAEEGVARNVFITRPLWGTGSYKSFLHDGSAVSIEEAILRHGGEAQSARQKFAALSSRDRGWLSAFLKSLVLFSVEDVLTAKIPITKGDVP